MIEVTITKNDLRINHVNYYATGSERREPIDDLYFVVNFCITGINYRSND
jgi:hypothetical protein